MLRRAALHWANHVRRNAGLPPARRLERGLLWREDECPLARTIGPCNVGRRSTFAFGRRYRMPLLVRLFVLRFDMRCYPDLITNLPLPRGIAHLDFEPSTPVGTVRV